MNRSHWIIARNMSIAAGAVLLVWLASMNRASRDGSVLPLLFVAVLIGAFCLFVRGLAKSTQLSSRAKAAANLDSLRATIFINSSLFYAVAAITILVQVTSREEFNGAYIWASVVGVLLLPIANAYLRIRADSHQFELGLEPHGDPLPQQRDSPPSRRRE
jgi:FtsH-binding integral membrane protein